MGTHELPLSRALALPRIVLSTYAGRLQLMAVVGVSFVLRSFAAFGHVSPRYFPDEYIYSSLARSLAEGKGPQIRGSSAHFPALLEPLLSAVFWLSGDAASAYRLTLLWHALAMSLAAVPVFLLCRRLQLSENAAVAGAAFSVALPSLTWASFLTADAIAYPLALTTVYVIVATLDSPTRRLQVLLPVLCGATTLARVQYVVLPVVFVAAAVVLERGRIGEVVRTYRLSLAILAAPLVVVLAAGPGKFLGYYSAVTSLSVDPVAILHWGALDIVLLMLATGVVLAPGAAIGILAGIVRPRTRAEAAFGIVGGLFAVALLFEAGLYASNGSPRFQERYLMALSPLLAPAFALGLRRSGAWRWFGGAVSAGLLLFMARIPISDYTLGLGKQDSPFLGAVNKLQEWTSNSTGALIVALAGALLALVGAAALVLTRRGLAVGLSTVCVVVSVVSLGATLYDHEATNRARNTYAPGDKEWVDHAKLGEVDLLALAYTPRPITPVHLFWNTSLRDVLTLPNADDPDAFRLFPVRIAPDGTLLKNGHPVRRPLLVEEYLGKASMQNAQRVSTTLMSTLWRPAGDLRFSWLARGRYFDGWLASASSITVWPDASGVAAGTLKLRFYLPGYIESGAVWLTGPGFHRTVLVATRGRVTVDVPVHATSVWTLKLRSTSLRFLSDGRDISVRSLPPIFERTSALKGAGASADRG